MLRKKNCKPKIAGGNDNEKKGEMFRIWGRSYAQNVKWRWDARQD
jgi:hypothetical protein